MLGLRNFLSLTLLGGLAVILPLALLLLIFQWLFQLVADLISPLTSLVADYTAVSDFVAALVVMGVILGGCFLVGLVVKTGVGEWLHTRVERALIKVAPGYKTIRAITLELLGGSGGASILKGEPVLAKIYGIQSPVVVTAIVTSRHTDGGVTVYVPTAPIPTSGITYHLPANCIESLPGITVEEAMRTIITCGSGSAEMLAKARNQFGQ